MRKLKLYDWPIWIINIGFAILFAAALMAGFEWASHLWLIQFLALAGIPFYLVNLLFLAYWLLRRRKHFVLPLAFLLLIHTSFTSLIKLRLPKEQVEKPNTIRVMTYNIKAFREQSPKQISENQALIKATIKAQQPDIILFQEFSNGDPKQTDFVRLIFDSLGLEYGFFNRKVSFNKHERAGLAIFSKFKISNREEVNIKVKQPSLNGCIYADLEIDSSQFIRVYSVHLASNNFGRNDFEALKQLTQNANVDKAGLNAVFGKLKSAVILRSQQANEVSNEIAQSPFPVIVGGDLNDVPLSFAYRKVARNLRDPFAEKGSGIGETYGGVFPFLKIDHIFLDAKFQTAQHHIVKSPASDHRAVVVDFIIPK